MSVCSIVVCLCTRLFVKNVGVVDVVVKKFYKFAVFFILLSVPDERVGVYGGGETAGPVGLCEVAGPDRRRGCQVPRDGRGRHQLHHLHRQARQGQGGGPGDVVRAGAGAQWHGSFPHWTWR